jgi:hypothetical protein
MSLTERQQPRHLSEPDQLREHRRVRWLGPAAAVVGLLLLLLVPLVFVLAVTRTTPFGGTRSAAVSQPARASAAPQAAGAAPQPLPSEDCRAVLDAAKRMTGHADAAVAQLRGHKQLMDDYKSGKIDRAAALPQDSPWRQALARTLKDGVAAADQYDADKATYRKLAAQCSKGG